MGRNTTATTTEDGNETDSSFAVRDTAERSKNRTSAASSILQQFRAARKALLDDEPPPPAAKKRSGETRGAFGMAARKFTLRSLARRAFGTAKTILAQGRPAGAAFLAEAFGPPDPGNPFDPMWQQPFTEDQPAFAENFDEDVPPANCPSANL